MLHYRNASEFQRVELLLLDQPCTITIHEDPSEPLCRMGQLPTSKIHLALHTVVRDDHHFYPILSRLDGSQGKSVVALRRVQSLPHIRRDCRSLTVTTSLYLTSDMTCDKGYNHKL